MDEQTQKRDGQRSMTLLWNDSSGWNEKEKIRQAVQDVLCADGTPLDLHRVQRGGDLCEESRSIVSSGTDVLIAAGGDGTINAAASALIHQKTALGVIPAGTFNHFARDLGIPLAPEDGAKTLLSGEIIEVDAATVNGRVFINNSVLGLFPNYRSARESWERHGFGSTRIGRGIAMAAAILRVFWRLPHLTVKMQVNGKTRQMRTPFVLVGNNEHRMHGLALGERSTLSGGNLWVYVLRPCSRWALLRTVIGLLLGRTTRESVFEVFKTSQFRIDSKRRRIGVGVDGEIHRMAPPLEYRLLPGALRVIAPASYAASHESP